MSANHPRRCRIETLERRTLFAALPSAYITVTTDLFHENAFEQDQLPATVTFGRYYADTTKAQDVSYSLTGEATSSADYLQLTGIAHFAAGESSVDVVIRPKNDSMKEGHERVVITTLPDPAGKYAIDANDKSATITIYDNDDASLTKGPTITAEGYNDREWEGIRVQWDTMPAATTYLIERASDPQFTQMFIPFVQNYPYVDESTDSMEPIVGIGDTVYYRVLAITPTGTTPWSSIVHATVPQPLPPYPYDLYAVPITNSIVRLTYSIPQTSEYWVRIERATDSDFTQNLTSFLQKKHNVTAIDLAANYATVTHSSVLYSYEDIGINSDKLTGAAIVMGSSESVKITSSALTGGGKRYRVVIPEDASIAAFNGTWSAHAGDIVDIVQGAHRLTIPSGGKITATELWKSGFRSDGPEFKIEELGQRNWIGADGRASFKIAVIGDNASYKASLGNLDSAFDTLPRPGEYYYRVRTISPSGQSYDPSTTSVTLPGRAPYQPAAVVVPVDATTNALEWDNTPDNETAFEIYRATDEQFTQDVTLLGREPGNVTLFDDRWVKPGVNYYYQVVAVNPFVTGRSLIDPKRTFALTNTAVSGRVFNDKNATGLFDGDDAGISGFRVLLDKAPFNGVVDANEMSKPVSTTGTYKFEDVPVGAYRVRIVPRNGWRQTSPALGYHEITLHSGEAARNLSFANTDTVLIKGTVFMDADRDGAIDSAESGLSAWRVFLDQNNNGVLDSDESSVITDANGNYRFFNLPAGKYVVRTVSSSRYLQTAPSSGAYILKLAAGATTSRRIFGEKRLK